MFFDRFRADINHDERVSREELLDHVFKNIQQHSREAKERNSQLFLLIDTDQDGENRILFNISQ
jgi:hypothetical protein